MAEETSHKRLFLDQEKQVYAVLIPAQKMPNEALITNKIPLFAMGLRRDSTFRDVYSAILEATQREVKKFLFKVPSEPENNGTNERPKDITYTYYGSDDQIEKDPSVQNADIQLCTTNIDEIHCIYFRFAITGSDWMKVVIYPQETDEKIDPGDLPIIHRVTMTVKKQEEVEGKKVVSDVDVKSMLPNDPSLSDADEEKYFRKLSKVLTH